MIVSGYHRKLAAEPVAEMTEPAGSLAAMACGPTRRWKMEPQSLGMSDQPSYRTLHQLSNLIASARGRIRRRRLALSTLPRGRLLVARARLTAAETRLAQLLAEHRRLRGEG